MVSRACVPGVMVELFVRSSFQFSSVIVNNNKRRLSYCKDFARDRKITKRSTKTLNDESRNLCSKNVEKPPVGHHAAVANLVTLKLGWIWIRIQQVFELKMY